MAIALRKGLAVFGAEIDPGLTSWLELHQGHVFRVRSSHGHAHFHSLGPEEEACRVPVNITSRSPGTLKLVSNFAPTPFALDGLDYGSVEAFWQGLKFPDEALRRALAPLYGSRAKDEGFRAPASDEIVYRGATVRIGTWDHWQLMQRACDAKFDQHAEARAALLSTGSRPLVHQMKRDSRTIPGVVMAEIWMRCRSRLAKLREISPQRPG
jgi:predicted NAD-dependent protein-ADP-ribosyltransferase YbiA (DUF1768 family)